MLVDWVDDANDGRLLGRDSRGHCVYSRGAMRGQVRHVWIVWLRVMALSSNHNCRGRSSEGTRYNWLGYVLVLVLLLQRVLGLRVATSIHRCCLWVLMLLWRESEVAARGSGSRCCCRRVGTSNAHTLPSYSPHDSVTCARATKLLLCLLLQHITRFSDLNRDGDTSFAGHWHAAVTVGKPCAPDNDERGGGRQGRCGRKMEALGAFFLLLLGRRA